MTSGSDFFGHPKNHQKINPSKIIFFRFLSHFGKPSVPILSIWGSKKGSWAVNVQLFFSYVFLHWFLIIFCKKKQKNKKWKSRFRLEKTILSWRSPCPKKSKDDWKKNNEKNIDFLVKNRRKIDEKVGCSALLSKNRKNACPVTPTFPKSTIFGRFWGPLGEPRIYQNGVLKFSKRVLEAIW